VKITVGPFETFSKESAGFSHWLLEFLYVYTWQWWRPDAWHVGRIISHMAFEFYPGYLSGEFDDPWNLWFSGYPNIGQIFAFTPPNFTPEKPVISHEWRHETTICAWHFIWHLFIRFIIISHIDFLMNLSYLYNLI